MKHVLQQSNRLTYTVHKAVFLMDKISNRILMDSTGLGLSQFLALLVLHDLTLGAQKDVANALGQTQAAVSRQIDILVGLKLVLRSRDPKSKRKYNLSLTPLGRKKLFAGFRTIDLKYGKFFKSWPEQDKRIVNRAFEKLLSWMDMQRT